MPEVTYQLEPELTAKEFQQVLLDSGLAPRRPATDLVRLGRMLRGADLIVTARDAEGLVGIARSVTDYAYCCYLSDLAVAKRVQGLGIGKELIEQTRRAVGAQVSVYLASAPAAIGFYERIGMAKVPAFVWKSEG